MFVCHGNICRSPMAEFIFKDMVKKRGLSDEYIIASSATSTEEIGNGMHHGTRRKLTQMNIPFKERCAVQLSREDYDKYDLIIAMDSMNLRWIERIIGSDSKRKIFRLMDFTDVPRDVADPWYTGDFDATYKDLNEGCAELLRETEKLRRRA